MTGLDLKKIVRDIREFEGLTRKKPIEDIVRIFENVRSDYQGTIIDFGDDAAVIGIGGDDVILFAADGIWGKITEASPWWAGYSSVLVNVNDISAMGGRPLAMVNILSTDNMDACEQLIKGISDGVKKFSVPMVGGHMHPDTPYTSISVAIIGIAKKDCIIRSDTAQAGDAVIAAYDLDGRLGPNSPYSWDTTSFKDPSQVREMYMVMQKIGEAKIATAGKDISNPGTIGTLGMLCESSKVGAMVDLDRIPVPDSVDLEQWLKVYPATGYVLTAKEENASECIRIFRDAGITAAVIGSINDSRRLEIFNEDSKATVFDFNSDTITGINMDF
ncbi:methanogenesis marker protein 2 [Methanosalsum zhilinae DSM 4017]|uniref:Methanogenesis marker protein 2 n=1 Tax=Methanosalsum zhilinae (strain DSM 4017 / NBRC 107636 / OCM 62 / WeN5) TaxID=679901 RepID=F7XPI0_METZD|nr:methanogenesis marker protein 2 [Methanosalsum zhilinae DSM 4017]